MTEELLRQGEPGPAALRSPPCLPGADSSHRGRMAQMFGRRADPPKRDKVVTLALEVELDK